MLEFGVGRIESLMKIQNVKEIFETEKYALPEDVVDIIKIKLSGCITHIAQKKIDIDSKFAQTVNLPNIQTNNSLLFLPRFLSSLIDIACRNHLGYFQL